MEQHASGKKFQEMLEEVIVHPLGIEGELYIGIPPGMRSCELFLYTRTNLNLLKNSYFL